MLGIKAGCMQGKHPTCCIIAGGPISHFFFLPHFPHYSGLRHAVIGALWEVGFTVRSLERGKRVLCYPGEGGCCTFVGAETPQAQKPIKPHPNSFPHPHFLSSDHLSFYECISPRQASPSSFLSDFSLFKKKKKSQ